MANKGHFKQYIDIPAAPTLSSPVTIIPSDNYATGFYNMPALLGSTKNAILSGNFLNAFNMRDAVGTSGTPIILVNAAGTIIGAAGVTHAIQTNNLPADHVRLYGLDKNNPMLLRTGNNGIQLGHNPTGSHFIIQNIVIDTPGTSGTTFNFGISGTAFYESIDISHLRVFNAGQEGICYIGNTGASYNGVNIIHTATVHDCFSYNSKREGTQFGHINNLYSYNNTVNISGQETPPPGAQDGLFQVIDCNGLIENTVYDLAPYIGVYCNHGMTVRNCYFRYTANTAFGILRSDTQSWAGTSTRLTNQPNLFDNCIFHVDSGSTLAKFCAVYEKNCNIEFRNCIFSSNITALYDDLRGGSSYSLIGTINTNGNSSFTYTPPTYVSNYSTYSDYTHHGLLVPGNTFYMRRMGNRTPRPA